MGSVLELDLLSEASFNRYLKLKAAGQCRADFYAANVIPVFIYPRNTSDKKEFRNLNFKEGDTITVKGAELEFDSVSLNGGQARRYKIPNLTAVLADTIETS